MHLDQPFLDKQKQKLLAEKARLEEELQFVTNPSTENPAHFAPSFSDIGKEEDENAQEVAVYEQSLGISGDLQAMLDEVRKALAKIEDGTYGHCEEGDDISRERLEAIPWANTCIQHAA